MSKSLKLYSESDRFKGLDLKHGVPEEIWMEICNVVQEAAIKTIPIKKKCKKPEEALQIAEKRREGTQRQTHTGRRLCNEVGRDQ